MDFKKIRWQSDIKNNLQQSIKEKTLRHAVLFVGDPGTSGDLADALANALLCDAGGTDMCGKCPSCAKLLAGSHPDKLTVKKLKNKASFGVEEVRDMISKMYIKPFLGNRKIFIFDDASALTPAAQNALLKVIEEPPAYGVLILCARKEEDLLQTVLSRIPHKFKLTPPTEIEIRQYLQLKYSEKKELAPFCAAFCQGQPALAESLIEENGAVDIRRRLCLFLTKLCGSEKSCIFNFCGYLKENADIFPQIADFWLAMLRDILFIKQNIPQIINSDLSSELKKLSEKWSEKAVADTAERLSQLLAALKGSANFEGAVLDFLLETWEALHDRNRRR